TTLAPQLFAPQAKTAPLCRASTVVLPADTAETPDSTFGGGTVMALSTFPHPITPPTVAADAGDAHRDTASAADTVNTAPLSVTRSHREVTGTVASFLPFRYPPLLRQDREW